MGHNVLTSLEAGQANRRISDDEVLSFATTERRVLLTQNRRDFLRLHQSIGVTHAGLVLCTADADFTGQARRIHDAIEGIRDGASEYWCASIAQINRA